MSNPILSEPQDNPFTSSFAPFHTMPDSPPPTEHKRTAIRNRIASRDLHASRRTEEYEGYDWTSQMVGGTVGRWEAPRTVERHRRGRAIDSISCAPTPPLTRDTRTYTHHPRLGEHELPPTPASTVRTKRMVNYRIVSSTSNDGDYNEPRNHSLSHLSIPEEDEHEADHEDGQDSWDARKRTKRAGLMFSRQMGTDGAWTSERTIHQLGSGLSGQRKRVREVQPIVREEELEETDREGTPDVDEDPNEIKKRKQGLLLSAAVIPGALKGNSFLQQLERVAAEKKEEQEKGLVGGLRRSGSSRLFSAAKNPFDDEKTGTGTGTGTAGKFNDRAKLGKGRLLLFGDDLSGRSEDKREHEREERRLPSPPGLIDFSSASLSKPSFPLPPSFPTFASDLKNPFLDSRADQPEPGPSRLASSSSPSSTSALPGKNLFKKIWKKPVSGGEDDPFAEKPGDLEMMRERQKNFVRGKERPVMEFTFRGQKVSSANPLFGLDGTPHMAQLPPTHPEFSPAPIPRPRLLLDKFKEQADKGKGKAKRERSEWSDSEEEGEEEAREVQDRLGPLGSGSKSFAILSVNAKRQTQSLLGKRARNQVDDEEEMDMPPAHRALKRQRSVSEQTGPGTPPITPARKRVQSSGAGVGFGVGTPRSSVRKTGLQRL